MNFGQAIEALKQGKRVARSGWNGKGMFLYLVNGSVIPVTELRSVPKLCDDGSGNVVIGSHIDMFTAQKTVCVGWLASQTDMLAEDWVIVD